MDLGIRLPTTSGSHPADFAEKAEERGFESVWQGELWGWNVFVQLAEVAQRTSDVRIGTSIVNVYSRSPAVLAMSANSLDRLADSEVVLGLGVSTPTIVEGLHSMAFDQPVRRTHETAELVQRFLSDTDESVSYDGEIFQVGSFSPLGADVQIHNAALGPANLRATGRVCDGWMPNNVPFSAFEDVFGTIADAARNAGRDPDDIERAPWIHVAVNDEDPDAARDVIRNSVAYYVGSGDGYRNVVKRAFPEQADRVADAWQSGNHDEARSAVTDEMVEDLACAGTAEAATAKLRSLVDEQPIDLPIVDIPPFAGDDIVEQSFEAVAPDQL